MTKLNFKQLLLHIILHVLCGFDAQETFVFIINVKKQLKDHVTLE